MAICYFREPYTCPNMLGHTQQKLRNQLVAFITFWLYTKDQENHSSFSRDIGNLSMPYHTQQKLQSQFVAFVGVSIYEKYQGNCWKLFKALWACPGIGDNTQLKWHQFLASTNV